MASKPAVIALAGATASGKSALALEMAKRLGGEIICMDSMQIYRRMDIGTAKPTLEERAEIPHHMLDMVEPDQPYAVADYAQAAERCISQVAARGKVPMLVGGTGLYLKALMHGMNLGGVKSDKKLRERLHAIEQEENGRERLHAMLAKVDVKTAQRLHPNDVRRVIRALEIHELTGIPMSEQRQEEADRPFRVLPLALKMPREMLFERIERRIQQMLDRGLLHEVEALLRSGVTPDMQSMQGIGYKELAPVTRGSVSVKDAAWQMILNTRHYAKRQGTWMRTEPATMWLDAEKGMPLAQAMLQAENFLNAGKE